MQGTKITACVLQLHLVFLLLLSFVVINLGTAVSAQSLGPLDVKHDTPGQIIKPGEAVHLDVELALVTVTVTDPYNRLVTGLEPDS